EGADLRAAFREAARASRVPRPASGLSTPDQPGPADIPTELPSGMLTFLVCARLPETDDRPAQVRAMQEFLPQLAIMLQQAGSRYGGLLVEPPEGPDGAVCVFPHAAAAVLAALSLQQALCERPGPWAPAAEEAASRVAP